MTVPLEGLMAINKPIGISSAEALRKLQRIFKPSSIFAETLAAEAAKRERESKGQQRRRRKQSARDLEVKIGHGGTLDPMASGVLVAGIGAGTKQLQQFLGCTKTYEATALFGAGTDTYDALGKIVAWGKEGSCGWERITEEVIEKELGAFRGDIMQKPPIYSALHMNGKRLYEYAREGKPLPAEIQSRPVSTVSLELLSLTSDHEYEYPAEEVPDEEKIALLAFETKPTTAATTTAAASTEEKATGEKRAHSPEPEDEKAAKKVKESEGEGEPVAETDTAEVITVAVETTPAATLPKKPEGKPPVATFRLTVTSGFYVRSFIHDLGKALGTEAHMVKLVRTRQGDYELGGEGVIEWEDLMDKGEEVWGPKVEGILNKWAEEKKGKK
ncbi:pseudouridine synthase [Tricharina praecox]|uniref:pseudouridine synthase n=1 Tax=Tricharina praecox TaxID=43433 RepID=UPI00221EF36E|nr:pseudouridine synthase [Tricharina praecox]KAI5845993.1 pseudouridine synthase [Tricharina praecox]